MRKIICVLALLFLLPTPVIAQDFENIDQEQFEKLRTGLVIQYKDVNPELIWQEYAQRNSAFNIALQMYSFKDPYQEFAMDKILSEELNSSTCGYILGETFSLRHNRIESENNFKDRVFKNCMGRPYALTFQDFVDLTYAHDVPSKYKQGIISRVLEDNAYLANQQLITLINSSTSDHKSDIASRINMNDLSPYEACQLKFMDIPGYNDFFNSLCEGLKPTLADSIKEAALLYIMMN